MGMGMQKHKKQTEFILEFLQHSKFTLAAYKSHTKFRKNGLIFSLTLYFISWTFVNCILHGRSDVGCKKYTVFKLQLRKLAAILKL